MYNGYLCRNTTFHEIAVLIWETWCLLAFLTYSCEKWKWPLVWLRPNISASTWPKFKIKDSFEILRTSRFQNWPYFLNLVKIWWRYCQKTVETKRPLFKNSPFNHGSKVFPAICICTSEKLKHLVLFDFGFCLKSGIWKNLKPQIDKALFLKPIKFGWDFSQIVFGCLHHHPQ